MFEGYKVYGPYGSGRKMVALVSPTHRTTMSYARYLMCLKEDRILGPEEQVDHIDGNHTNDALENLQILTPQENLEKDFARRRENLHVTLTCPQCGTEFPRLRRLIGRSDRSKTPCCSRSCSGKYHVPKRWPKAP